MEISLELLINKINELGMSSTIMVDIGNVENPMLVFQSGKITDNGNIRILLDFKDLKNIIVLNEESENDVYETLSKYIFEMLNASVGNSSFPDIKSLDKHKDFFRNNQ